MYLICYRVDGGLFLLVHHPRDRVMIQAPGRHLVPVRRAYIDGHVLVGALTLLAGRRDLNSVCVCVIK